MRLICGFVALAFSVLVSATAGAQQLPADAALSAQITCEQCGKAGEALKADREDLDLVAQKSMADAAWAMVCATWAQAVVGAFSLVGLGLTVFYAKRAAEQAALGAAAAQASVLHAEEGAKAAQASADFAYDQFAKLQRPYLAAFDVMMPNPNQFPLDQETGQPPHFLVYDVANVGNTPAVIDYVSTSVDITRTAEIDPGLMEDFQHPLFVSYVMSAGKQHSKLRCYFRENDIIDDAIIKYIPRVPNDHTLYFSIVIRYHGPFTAGHETRACWRYSLSSGVFVRIEDATLNYIN